MEMYYQQRIETLVNYVWGISAIFSTLVAYIMEDQRYAWFTCALASLLVVMFIVPPWPMYKSHPTQWKGVETKHE